MGKRNEKGQFIMTTGGGRYKRRMVDGKNCSVSRLVWEENFGKIPEGLIIHHVDKDKMNNDINNLALMTVTAHNRLHAPGREIWNTGLSTKTSKKWKETIAKRDKIKKAKYNKKLEDTWELYCCCLSANEIAEKLNICNRQVYSRMKDLTNNHSKI